MKTKISIWISFFNCFPYQSGKTILLQMRTFPFTFIPLYIFYSSIPLLCKDSQSGSLYSHLDSPHSHPCISTFPPWFPAFSSSSPWFPAFSSFPPWFLAFLSWFLVFPIITTLISGIPTMFHRIPIIPPIPFAESPFWLLQIAFRWRSRNGAGNCSFYGTF